MSTTPPPPPGSSLRYVAIGASDTTGVGASDPATGSWPARVARLLPPGGAFVNVGVGGSTAIQALDEQLPRAIAQRPTVVTVWLAVNDINDAIAPAAFHAALARLIGGFVAETAALVFVGNVPDVRGVPAFAGAELAGLAALIDAYNEAIAAAVAAHPGRAFVVDLHTGSAALMSAITVSPDGFHPSDEGYALIATRFADTMRASGVPLER